MKLHYISHWRFPSEKTMSPLIMRTCEEFSNQGVDVTLVFPKRQDREFKNENPYTYHSVENIFNLKTLPVVDLIESVGGKFSFLLMLISFNFSLFFYALKNKEGVFYVHDSRDVFLLSFLNRKYVLEIHDFYESKLGFLNSRTFRKAYKFVVTNQYKIDLISKKYNLPKDKFLHKPNAVNISMFDLEISKEEAREKVDLPKDKKIVLYAGHLFDWKGVDTLLEAHKHLEDYEIYFIGGTKEDVSSVQNKADKMNAKNVHLLGMRPHSDIPYYYKSADVLVLPNTAKMDVSKYETSPVKLFEYMASKTPIVASDIPSIRNIATDEMVWFFTPDDSKNLSEVILSLNNKREEIINKIGNSYTEVQKHTWSRRIGDIKDFIYV